MSARPSHTLLDIFQTLAVPRDRIIYIHSSMDWMRKAGLDIHHVLSALLDWTSETGGTVAMPAYPFRGLHEDYLIGDPVLDVRRTPAMVGLLNETLRRRKGVWRSLDCDLSIIATGSQSSTLIGSHLTGPDPTGSDSPFQRIIDQEGYLMGLGVSFNYMNMIHVVDSWYRHRYPFHIYSSSLYRVRSIDVNGKTHEMRKHAMLRELQTYIKPSRVISTLKPSPHIFRSIRVGETDFFLWDLTGFKELCVGHVESQLASGQTPCWLSDVGARIEERSDEI